MSDSLESWYLNTDRPDTLLWMQTELKWASYKAKSFCLYEDVYLHAYEQEIRLKYWHLLRKILYTRHTSKDPYLF